MEAFETFEHAGMTCELHQDFDPMSPAEWDNLGTLVIDSRTGYSLGERETTMSEDEAINRGGARLLLRYLSIVDGVIAVPFHFADYGSSGARIWAVDADEQTPSGYIYTTHKRVSELCGEGAEYHSKEWIENALRGELETWSAYVEGLVCGFVVRDSAGEVVESVWGFYPDNTGDGLDELRSEARAAAQHEADARAETARLWAFGNVAI